MQLWLPQRVWVALATCSLSLRFDLFWCRRLIQTSSESWTVHEYLWCSCQSSSPIAAGGSQLLLDRISTHRRFFAELSVVGRQRLGRQTGRTDAQSETQTVVSQWRRRRIRHREWEGRPETCDVDGTKWWRLLTTTAVEQSVTKRATILSVVALLQLFLL